MLQLSGKVIIACKIFYCFSLDGAADIPNCSGIFQMCDIYFSWPLPSSIESCKLKSQTTTIENYDDSRSLWECYLYIAKLKGRKYKEPVSILFIYQYCIFHIFVLNFQFPTDTPSMQDWKPVCPIIRPQIFPVCGDTIIRKLSLSSNFFDQHGSIKICLPMQARKWVMCAYSMKLW